MILAILLALSAWLLSFVLPWWSLAFPALILGAILGTSGARSFGYGALGIAGWWLIHTLYIHTANDGILTSRIADLFSLPYPWLLIVITVLIGGLAGGLATLTGYQLKRTFISLST